MHLILTERHVVADNDRLEGQIVQADERVSDHVPLVSYGETFGRVMSPYAGLSYRGR